MQSQQVPSSLRPSYGPVWGPISSRGYTPCTPNNEWIIPCTQSDGDSLSPLGFVLNYPGSGPRVITRWDDSMGRGQPSESWITIFFFGGSRDPFHSARWRETRFPFNLRKQRYFCYTNVVRQLNMTLNIYIYIYIYQTWILINILHKKIKGRLNKRFSILYVK